MPAPAPSPPELVDAVERATTELLRVLEALSPADLVAPSRLPGWSRCTIVCHLRYGAAASARMTEDALAGRTTAFYPDGRDRQRPGTLALAPGESAGDACRSLRDESGRLGRLWSSVPGGEWGTVVRESAGNPDLGDIDLATLALLRLTEVEVHGADLDVGLDRWSDVFVTAALPVRLARLDRQRRVGRDDPLVGTTWWLRPVDGPAHAVTLGPDRTEVRPATATGTASGDDLPPPDAVVEGTAADLLALLLGRPAPTVTYGGDVERARAFARAYGGP